MSPRHPPTRPAPATVAIGTLGIAMAMLGILATP